MLLGDQLHAAPTERDNIKIPERLCTKSHDSALLCVISVFSVTLWLMNSEQNTTTETKRTQRLHREISEQGLLVQSLPEL